ncbi:MAG: 5-dehydro-4-deoxy-D-glucuronate isomerase [Rikenellaceae bacterium]|nr:5-dehydro-4-deoxy-D-glucuronate isomerase [Rikenellaceae bacterium]
MKTNCQIRFAAHPNDARRYDTEALRDHFLIENVMVPGMINLTYSMYDRMIAGGVVPADMPLELEAVDILRAPFFTSARELGIINVGGSGKVTVGDKSYTLDCKEALYVGRGDRKVFFESADKARPAKFYINSATAHTAYPDKKITKADAVVMEMGAPETGNHRIINRMIVTQTVATCQVQMGMTELQAGSVWNTMPPHTHDRRMEVYFYFEVPEGQAVCHFMGEPQQTRHIWMANEQAVISPQWSIHSACGTSSYTFIWGMGGENLDYNDMDTFPITELR